MFLAPTDLYNLFTFLFGVLLFKHDELLQNTKMLGIDVQKLDFYSQNQEGRLLEMCLVVLPFIHATTF